MIDETDIPAAPNAETPAIIPPATAMQRVWGNGSVRIGAAILGILLIMAIGAPWLGTVDPTAIDPSNINIAPGSRATITDFEGRTQEHYFLMGGDSYGRDTWSRIAYGARVSLLVGAAVAVFCAFWGSVIGLLSGYFRWLDGIIMRLMDSFMAIPNILFAIALITVWRASVLTIIVAISIPEIPRIARLLRSIVLTLREEPYVEAAIALNTPTWKVLLKHILPNAVAPLIVHITYVFGSAMLIEAILSFLGIGLSAEIPSWGIIMSEGRVNFSQHPEHVLFPGFFLALTVLSINILGDGLRDSLDPKLRGRV